MTREPNGNNSDCGYVGWLQVLLGSCWSPAVRVSASCMLLLAFEHLPSWTGHHQQSVRSNAAWHQRQHRSHFVTQLRQFLCQELANGVKISIRKQKPIEETAVHPVEPIMQHHGPWERAFEFENGSGRFDFSEEDTGLGHRLLRFAGWFVKNFNHH